jgi:YVTN family beta-propeller protein
MTPNLDSSLKYRLVRAALVAIAFAASARTIAAQMNGTVIVANQQSASATIVDVASKNAVTLDVGSGPHEAVISPDGRWGVVTIYGLQTPGNQLAIVDLAAKKVVRTIDLGEYKRPHGAAFIAGSLSNIVVTSEATQNVVLVDIAAGKVLSAIPTNRPGSHMLGITRDGSRLWTSDVSFGGISEIDLANKKFARDLPVAAATEGIAAMPDGSAVWVGSNKEGTVSIIDTKTWAVATTLPNLGMPYRIGISPDGSIAAVCDPEGNKVVVVDAKTRKVLGNIESLGSPRGVIIAPDNRTAFVTLGRDNAVVGLDLVALRETWRSPVGASPDGVGFGKSPN